ncbi:MAG: metal-sulfur cluster assembly factor [Sandaracinaceae bacterium]|nr:metal-sulfur cluster assembly factor [Sandaracinaceae bacterium]
MTPTTDTVRGALRQVLDPEIGLDVVALGLVYDVVVREGEVRVELTMTTAACPLAESIVEDARRVVAALPGVRAVEVRLVWEPPWTPARMSSEARRELGWDR